MESRNNETSEEEQESYRKLASFDKSLKNYKYEIYAEKIINQPGDINYQCPPNVYFKIRLSDFIGCSALHIALSFKNKRIFNVLLNDSSVKFTLKNNQGLTVLHQSIRDKYDNFKENNNHWRSGVFQAKVNDDFAKSVLNAHVTHKINENPIDDMGISHFHIACMTNHHSVVEFFLGNQPSLVNHRINEDSLIFASCTPLHIAAFCGCVDVVKILLKYDADKCIKNANGLTALESVTNRNIEIIDWMHTRCETIPNFPELKEELADKEMIIRLIIADNNVTNNDNGFSSLHAASTLKDTSIVKQLLKDKSIDPNYSVNVSSTLWPGYTPLHFAAHFNVEVIKLLANQGANLTAKDIYGVTPLDMIVERFKLQDLYEILTTQSFCKDIKLSDGKTKLMDLLGLMKDPESFRTFLELGEVSVNNFVPFNSPLWPGCSILHLAAMFTETVEIVDNLDDVDEDSEYYSDESEKRYSKSHELIEICLESGADALAKDSRGWTPIQLAFRLQSFKAVKYMLNYHKDITNDPIDSDNLSHLYIACHVDHTKHAENLLSSTSNNANITLSSSFFWHPNETSFVQKYRSCGLKSEQGSTPLHAAVTNGNKQLVSLLLEHDADVNVKDGNGSTPLHRVLRQHRNYDMMDLLFARSNLQDVAFDHTLTHLHLAVFFNNTNAVEKLLDVGADINATLTSKPNSEFKHYDNLSVEPLNFISDYNGCTALHIAMGLRCIREYETPMGHNSDVAKLLLKRGADMFIANSVGRCVAYMSLTRRYLDNYQEDIEIEFLQREPELQKRMFEHSGITMLHVSCWKLDVDAVENLMSQRGVDVNAQARVDSPVWPGWTPLHVLMLMAANRKNDSNKVDVILRILLENGADVTIQNKDLDTPLHLTQPETLPIEVASHVQYRCYVDSPYTGILLNELKDNKSNPRNANDITYFHVASLRNDVDRLRTFLLNGVKINEHIDFFSQRYPGCTALHLALNSEVTDDNAYSKRLETVKLLIENGADIHARDVYGNTPLHVAVNSGFPGDALFQLVLSAGADVNATNMLGETAFEVFLKSGNVDSSKIKYFLEYGCRINGHNTFSGESYIGIISINSIVEEMIDNWEEILINDSNGRTAIHNLVATRNSKLESYDELIGTLMNRGCNIDGQDEQGSTAVHLAVKFFNLKAVNALMKQGADMNIIDVDGKTAFARFFEYYGKNIMSGWGGSYLVMAKSFVMYIRKMQLCGLELHDLNIQVLNDISGHVKVDENDMKKFNEELSEAIKVKIGSSQLTFFYFLSNMNAWESFPIALHKTYNSVEEFFGLIGDKIMICNEFPESIGILRLRFRKFKNSQI